MKSAAQTLNSRVMNDETNRIRTSSSVKPVSSSWSTHAGDGCSLQCFTTFVYLPVNSILLF